VPQALDRFVPGRILYLILIFTVVASLSVAMSETAYAAEREKATYVSGGRYVGEG
jgi:hypothetical protein